MHTATLQVFSYCEPNLFDTLDAYASCRIPDGWEVEYQACVTPSTVPVGMVDHATAHPTFELLATPAGKLSARNVAHNRAVDAGTDVIVVADADTRPTMGALASLLEPLSDSDVVASNGMPIKPWKTPVNVASNVIAAAEDAVRPHLHGQFSAVTATGWQAAGPFDDARDQTDGRTVRTEEERAFYRRIQRVGDVARPGDAVVYESPRRVLYHLNKAYSQLSLGRYPLSEWERQRGVDTFAPRDRR